tara:strand:+ start:2551 stop:2871 length:321 start_codon:yes stop_codon:yes gene_type:complete
LANKPPVGLKTGKPKKNKKYLDKIRQMPCCICQRFGENQQSPTTAHHPIHERYSTAKVADEKAIPLCEGHHQGNWDQSKIAIHKEPKLWQETYGPDYSYSRKTELT